MKVVGVAPDANIFRSWVEAAISMPIQVRQVYPENWHVKDVSLLGPNFAASTDLAELWDADVIVTDSWPSDANEKEMLEYQISTSILEKCRPDAIFIQSESSEYFHADEPDAIKNAEKDVGAPIKLTKFVRYALGEGIEKQETDFAAEVAATAGAR
jgi:hypothetical protein